MGVSVCGKVEFKVCGHILSFLPFMGKLRHQLFICLKQYIVSVVQKGVSPPPSGYDFDFPNVQVSINDAYACTIYTSCKQTSFIAAAGLSSAVGFLNFLGTNGAPYSLSYINFTESYEGQTAGEMESEAIPCEQAVNDTLWGYSHMKNSTCSFCAKVCPPPVVNDDIGFLDGFSWRIVGFSYLGFVLFIIAFQAFSHCFFKKRKMAAAEAEARANNLVYEPVANNNESSMMRQGRPVNVTRST